MHPFISRSQYRYTSKIWAGSCKLVEFSLACGCELVAVDRGQEIHLVAKITLRCRQELGPARQCQKMRRSRLFCSVTGMLGFFSPHNIIQKKFLQFYFKKKLVVFHPPISVPGIYRVPDAVTPAVKWAALHDGVCSRLDKGTYFKGGWFEFQFEKIEVLFQKLLHLFHLEDMKREIW